LYKQAKEWTPSGKAKKENPAKKFYSESEEEQDPSDSSSDSGGFYKLLIYITCKLLLSLFLIYLPTYN
jgi:hypothetical protein